jgi:putative endonuclease
MDYLARRGWRIEAHRFRLGHSDLDLVARREHLVAFFLVKTRGSAGWGAPAQSVRWRKRRTIARLAEVWRERHGRPADAYRFDVIEVRVEEGRGFEVEHLEDAWRMG